MDKLILIQEGDSLLGISDFFRQPEYNHIKQSATSPATPFEVVSPPRKSSEQLRHEGKMLI